MRESHDIYETPGIEAYSAYQRQHSADILDPGDDVPLASKYLPTP